MRFTTKIMTAAAALVLATATVAPATPSQPSGIVASVTAVSVTPAAPVASMTAATVAQDAKLEVDVNTNDGGAWYTQPVWIAIGIIALVLIVVLIMAAGRRDTTVVK